jgi:uncharacterized membrane protein
MVSTNDAPRSNRSRAVALNRIAYWICKYWIALFSVLFGLYVGLPLLAPVLMAAGVTPLGQLIYAIYSFLCHQLPERSFFFFGPKIMYPLAEIQSRWQVTDNALILRQFTGAPGMGWKVAWSDRMVAMFTSMLPFAWLWWLLRKKVRGISWKVLLVFLLPMALDGTTHFISDLAGLHHGFRDSNAWLALLTQNSLPAGFYSGDAWGSFNSIMRLVSGVLFGIGIVWFGFPHLDGYFQDQAAWIRYKFERANLKIS